MVNLRVESAGKVAVETHDEGRGELHQVLKDGASPTRVDGRLDLGDADVSDGRLGLAEQTSRLVDRQWERVRRRHRCRGLDGVNRRS